MRISDWSSDVCSSDLCAGFEPRQPLELVEPGEDARRVARDVCRQRAVFVGRGAEQLLLDHLGKALQRVYRGAQLMEQLSDTVGFARLRRKFEQIGRASGRERVCQYV